MSEFNDSRELNVTVLAIPKNEGLEIRIRIEGEIKAGKCVRLVREAIDWESIRGVVYAKLVTAIEKEIPPFKGALPFITTFKKATESKEEASE